MGKTNTHSNHAYSFMGADSTNTTEKVQLFPSQLSEGYVIVKLTERMLHHPTVITQFMVAIAALGITHGLSAAVTLPQLPVALDMVGAVTPCHPAIHRDLMLLAEDFAHNETV